MKILFIAPYLPSLIRVRPYQFVRELSKRHRVTVLATSSAAEVAHADELRAICDELVIVPLRLTGSALSCAAAAVRGEPLQSAVCHSPELTRRLREVMAARTFDIVHVEHLRAARVATQLPAAMPRLFDAVDSISLLLERTLRASHSIPQRLIALLELRRTSRFEGWILQHYDETIITAPEDRTTLQRLAPQASVSVVPNGVDLDYFAPVPDQEIEPDTIVFSGKMSYHANVTAALHFAHQILPLIRAKRPTAHLRIVGSNPPRSIRQLESTGSITVTGYVQDMRPLLRRASVAICPVTVKVGIQNKLLEAMALGIPVVSTTEGASGLGAVAGRDLRVASGAREFAEDVVDLLEHPARARELGRCGRQYVEQHHRWDKAVATVERLYIQALEARRARGA